MENVAAIAVIAVGAFVLIVGARGTQSAVFGNLFPKPASSGNTSTTSLPGGVTPPEGKWTFGPLTALAMGAGFSQAQSYIAAAIALAESAGNAAATGPLGEQGLWQIYPAAHPDLAKKYNLYDPVQNSKAAFEVFQKQGWKAWTTYLSGAYKQFLHGYPG